MANTRAAHRVERKRQPGLLSSHNGKGQNMAGEGEFAISQKRYAAETHRRIARTISGLLKMEGNGGGDISQVLLQVRRQEEASRRAGFERVARLCQSMEDCLTGIRSGEQPRLDAFVTTLVEVCQAIELHADAIAATVA